ncbi:hypothetical protein IFM89_019463 [Coptis chinensis]|uniref:Uncharacterized protein n=1 Tax=Coptis chinensis TaxID=261450 RepID=A0A835LE55_9MAGN|nr:hypothetical protein IFM89_019463 [Coptis chinensis]
MEENVTQRTGEKRKGRGAVVCSRLTKMKENERVDVVFNQNGQRIGEGGKDLASYSVCLVASRVSIATYGNWHDVKGEARDRLWKFIKVYQIERIPGVLFSMCNSCREKYRELILREGAIPGLLQLRVNGTWRAKGLAKSLLLLLREESEFDSRRQLGGDLFEQIMTEIYSAEEKSKDKAKTTQPSSKLKPSHVKRVDKKGTDSTYDLRTGEVKDWYPKNVVLRVLTPSLRPLFVYSVKLDADNIYISLEDGVPYGASAEIVFSGKAQPGATASDVNVDEVRMIVDEGETGFGFTKRNELINGKTAAIGFLLLLDFELLTGKGLLKGTGGHSFFTAYGLWLQQYSLQQLSNSVAKLV